MKYLKRFKKSLMKYQILKTLKQVSDQDPLASSSESAGSRARRKKTSTDHEFLDGPAGTQSQPNSLSLSLSNTRPSRPGDPHRKGIELATEKNQLCFCFVNAEFWHPIVTRNGEPTRYGFELPYRLSSSLFVLQMAPRNQISQVALLFWFSSMV